MVRALASAFMAASSFLHFLGLLRRRGRSSEQLSSKSVEIQLQKLLPSFDRLHQASADLVRSSALKCPGA